MKKFVRSTLWVTVVLATIFSARPTHAQNKSNKLSQLTFVANQLSNDMSGYSVATNGALLPLSNSPFGAGQAPNSVAVVPSGRFVYVADVVPGGISAFRVDKFGAVSPLPGAPFASETGTAFVTTDPTGHFLYALSCGENCSGTGSGDIQVFTIDQNTGALAPVVGSPFAAGQYPYSLAMNPTGTFAYVANAGSGDVYTYSVNMQSGVLTQFGSPVAAGTRPLSVAVDPLGLYVFAANTTSGECFSLHHKFRWFPGASGRISLRCRSLCGGRHCIEEWQICFGHC